MQLQAAMLHNFFASDSFLCYSFIHLTGIPAALEMASIWVSRPSQAPEAEVFAEKYLALFVSPADSG